MEAEFVGKSHEFIIDARVDTSNSK